MSGINIDDYCTNPGKYIGGLQQETVNYYNSLCDARKQLSEPSTGEKIGETVVMLPLNMIRGILTPEGLKLLSIIYGMKFIGKAFATNLLRVLASNSVVEAADAVASGGFSAFLSNVAALSEGIIEAATETTLATLAVELIGIISSVVNVAEFIMIVFIITSAIFDAWDPCGFGKTMSGDDLLKVSDSYNTQFRDKIISKIARGQNVDGSPIYTDEYPIIYNIDKLLLTRTFDDQAKKLNYITEYYSKLTYNSNGESIDWKTPMELIKKKDLEDTVSELSIIVTDNNTVLFKIVKNNFVWILIFITLFILFILFLKF